MEDRVSAFVSYSWDSEDHEQWVMDLVNKLRSEAGVDVKLDKFITQKNTTNLNTMMVRNLREKDYLLIVLTEGYAQKANDFTSGVGFENTLTLPILQENLNKIIFILRSQGDFHKAVPFHFKGYHFIDFTDEGQYEKKFKELIHRIYQKPLYQNASLGDVPDLKPLEAQPVEDTFDDAFLSTPNQFTDLDKDEFLKKGFREIKDYFNLLFQQVGEKDPSFQFRTDEISRSKMLFHLYHNGKHITSVKMWIGNQFGHAIHLMFGKSIDPSVDNQMNESISCEINEENQLTLKLMMGFTGQEAHEPKSIVEHLWESHIKNQLNYL